MNLNDELPFKLGFEWTFHLPTADDFSTRIFAYEPKNKRKLNSLNKILFKDVREKEHWYVDGHCVEFPTKPSNSLVEIEKQYQQIRKVVDSFGMQTHVDGIVGGGSHITVGPISLQHAIKTVRDISIRPYINWLFNDYSDNNNANCVSYSGKNNNFFLKFGRSDSFAHQINRNGDEVYTFSFERFGTPHTSDIVDGLLNTVVCSGGSGYFVQSKDFAVSIRNYIEAESAEVIHHDVRNNVFTCRVVNPKVLIEFRLFDNAVDFEEVKLQIDFLLSYMSYTETLTNYSDNENFDSFQGANFRKDKKKVRSEIKKFFRCIDLNYKKYERFMERIDFRFQLGASYLR